MVDRTALAHPKVAILILHWNNAANTLRCLQAVATSRYERFESIVVDNGSTDGSVAVLREAHPGLTILETGANLGFAGGNNVGIAYALRRGADYILLLNDDTVVEPQTIPALIAAARLRADAGFLGPAIYSLEQPESLLSAGGYLEDGWHTVHQGLAACAGYLDGAPTEVDFVSGAALLASRRVVETVGLLDEQYFMYREDVDWCYRGRRSGMAVVAVPAARVWHPDTRARDVDSPRVTYYLSRNTLLFIRKHRMGRLLLARVALGYARTLASWSIRPHWRAKQQQRNALARALWDFATGHVGPG